MNFYSDTTTTQTLYIKDSTGVEQPFAKIHKTNNDKLVCTVIATPVSHDQIDEIALQMKLWEESEK